MNEPTRFLYHSTTRLIISKCSFLPSCLHIYCTSFFFPSAVESCSHSILLYPTRTSTIALVWLKFGGETLNGFELIELIIFFRGGGGEGSKVTPW